MRKTVDAKELIPLVNQWTRDATHFYDQAESDPEKADKWRYVAIAISLRANALAYLIAEEEDWLKLEAEIEDQSKGNSHLNQAPKL